MGLIRMAKKPSEKPKPKLSDKEQSERFKETARKLGASESADAFDRTFKAIVSVRRSVKKAVR